MRSSRRACGEMARQARHLYLVAFNMYIPVQFQINDDAASEDVVSILVLILPYIDAGSLAVFAVPHAK